MLRWLKSPKSVQKRARIAVFRGLQSLSNFLPISVWKSGYQSWIRQTIEQFIVDSNALISTLLKQ